MSGKKQAQMPQENVKNVALLFDRVDLVDTLNAVLKRIHNTIFEK